MIFYQSPSRHHHTSEKNNDSKSYQYCTNVSFYLNDLAIFPLHGPALVLGHVLLAHVVTVLAGDGELIRVVTNLLDLVTPGLAVGRLGVVHLVAHHDELLDPRGHGCLRLAFPPSSHLDS